MKSLVVFLFFVTSTSLLFAQLPNRVKKLEGLWEYRQGSGYEKWERRGEVMYGESFRINKLGDTLVAEKFEISYVNKRLILNLTAYHMVNDSIRIKEKVLVGKRRKMKFTGLNGNRLEELEFKFGLFSRNRLKLLIHHHGILKPQKLRMVRR
ncbi:MAG: hypothetical protein NXI10_07010 [bacterium]|nr:hypothetical protein [bacterium]